MHYFILAVSKNRAQLLEITGDKVLPRAVEGMPVSMADAWKGMERSEQSLQFHSSGSGTAAFHGSGGVSDLVEKEEDQYVHSLAQSLHALLHEQHDPLVFAGVTELYGMFKKFDSSGKLLDDYIQGSPDQLNGEDLKTRADEIVKKHLLTQNERFLEQFGNLQGTGKTSTEESQIAERARAGKVEVLLLPDGTVNELLEADVLAHRGRVVRIADGHMPNGVEIAAILRL